MKKLPLRDIKDLPTKQVIDDLRSCKYSLLECAGCNKLRKEMRGPGLACRTIINLAWHTTGGGNRLRHDRRVAKKLSKFLAWGAPADVIGKLPDDAHNIVVGFNHPSLGEIIRFIAICLSDFRHTKNLFPVNLPWYEALMPVVDKLERLGIYITPIITPSTYEKMKLYVSKEDFPIIEELRKTFSLRYIKLCSEFSAEGNCIIWVAPSATRQATVFQSKECYDNEKPITPRTMTLIGSSIVRAKAEDCCFVATGVVPPKNGNRGLNLFKEYTICFGSIWDYNAVSQLIREEYPHGGKMFEYDFLKSICRVLDGLKASYLNHP